MIYKNYVIYKTDPIDGIIQLHYFNRKDAVTFFSGTGQKKNLMMAFPTLKS